MAEELVLTALVLAYFVFDLWVISFDFRLIKNHYYITPILVIIVLIYSLWAEHHLKSKIKKINSAPNRVATPF